MSVKQKFVSPILTGLGLSAMVIGVISIPMVFAGWKDAAIVALLNLGGVTAVAAAEKIRTGNYFWKTVLETGRVYLVLGVISAALALIAAACSRYIA